MGWAGSPFDLPSPWPPGPAPLWQARDRRPGATRGLGFPDPRSLSFPGGRGNCSNSAPPSNFPGQQAPGPRLQGSGGEARWRVPAHQGSWLPLPGQQRHLVASDPQTPWSSCGPLQRTSGRGLAKVTGNSENPAILSPDCVLLALPPPGVGRFRGKPRNRAYPREACERGGLSPWGGLCRVAGSCWDRDPSALPS